MSELRRLLGNRSFRQIWLASLVTGLGDQIAIIALYILIFNLTGKALDLGILAAVQILPAILLGPLIGVLLDRLDRKRVMIWADVASALVAAALPLADRLGVIYLLAGLLAVGRQFTGPARLALVPDVVEAQLLGKANALAMITRNVVLLVGPAVGGVLAATAGVNLAFGVDAVTFLASAALLAVRPLRYLGLESATTQAPSTQSVEESPLAGRPSTTPPRLVRGWREMTSGAAVVWQHRRLRFAVLFFAAITFVTAMQQPLVVLFVKTRLQGGDLDLGLVVSAAGLGGILGAMAGGLVLGTKHPLRTVTWLMVIDGLLLVVFALNRQIWAALAIFGLFGAIGTVSQVCIATFLQRETPAAQRGRVFGWLGTFVGPLSLVSVFLGPALAGLIGVAVVLGLSGAFEALVGLMGRAALQRVGAPATGSADEPPLAAREAAD